MANENKNKKTEAAVRSAPQPTEWPVVKCGKFLCSDGQEFSDGYFAREHQKQLNKQ